MKKSKVNAGIGKQLKILYVVAILIPVTLLGSIWYAPVPFAQTGCAP